MTTETPEQGPVLASQETPDISSLPELLGVDVRDIQNLGWAASGIDLVPTPVNRKISSLPAAIELFPLVQKIGSEAPEAVDIKPYIGPLREFSGNFSTLYALTRPSPRLREALMRKATERIVERTTENVEKARQKIDALHLEEDIEFLKEHEIENPKEKLIEELTTLAETAERDIKQIHAARVHAGLPPRPVETRGFLGFFGKISRGIRRFFGMFRRPQNRPSYRSVSAYDAGLGLKNTFNSLSANRVDTRSRLPLISHFILDRMKDSKLPAADNLAFLAPELLHFMFSALPDSQDYKDLLASVTRNPHDLRFLTHFKQNYKGYHLRSIQGSARNLVPSLLSVIPTSTEKLAAAVQNTRQFFEAFQPLPGDPTAKKRAKAERKQARRSAAELKKSQKRQ